MLKTYDINTVADVMDAAMRVPKCDIEAARESLRADRRPFAELWLMNDEAEMRRREALEDIIRFGGAGCPLVDLALIRSDNLVPVFGVFNLGSRKITAEAGYVGRSGWKLRLTDEDTTEAQRHCFDVKFGDPGDDDRQVIRPTESRSSAYTATFHGQIPVKTRRRVSSLVAYEERHRVVIVADVDWERQMNDVDPLIVYVHDRQCGWILDMFDLTAKELVLVDEIFSSNRAHWRGHKR